MRDWLKSLFADAQGLADDGRVAAFVSVLGFVIFAGWNLMVEHHPFDPVQYGTGAGLLFTGIGAFFGIRRQN